MFASKGVSHGEGAARRLGLTQGPSETDFSFGNSFWQAKFPKSSGVPALTYLHMQDLNRIVRDLVHCMLNRFN